MSETSGMGAGAWLPPRAALAWRQDEAHERAEAKREEAERADRADKHHEAALAAYAQQAQLRGEVVSALAIARGDGGRTFQDVLTDAVAAADREDARAAAREGLQDAVWIGSGEPVIREPASRSGIVDEYELSRTVRQLEDGRTWMAGYQLRQASRAGRAAEHIEAERAKANRAHVTDLRRDRATSSLTSWSEISR